MTLYGAAKAPAVPKGSDGTTVDALGGDLTGTVDGDMADVADVTTATALALSTSDTYTDSAVNTAVNAAVDAAVDAAVNGVVADVNIQLKELQTKINALISHMNDGRS